MLKSTTDSDITFVYILTHGTHIQQGYIELVLNTASLILLQKSIGSVCRNSLRTNTVGWWMSLWTTIASRPTWNSSRRRTVHMWTKKACGKQRNATMSCHLFVQRCLADLDTKLSITSLDIEFVSVDTLITDIVWYDNDFV